MSRRLEELKRSCGSSRPARWQRGGQRNRRRKRAIASAEVSMGGFWATAPPIAHVGRSLDVSRWKIGRVALERRAARALAARRNSQTALGSFLKFVQERTFLLVGDVEIDAALVAQSNDSFVQRVQSFLLP